MMEEENEGSAGLYSGWEGGRQLVQAVDESCV